MLRLVVFGLLLGLFLLFTVQDRNLDWQKSQTSLSPYDLDLLEYQTMAVNFALCNKFPVFGFLLSKEKYNFECQNPNGQKVTRNFALTFFDKTGPARFIRKPPLYGFTLGLIYKLWGVDLRAIFVFQLLILWLSSILLINIGKSLAQKAGELVGFLSAILFIYLKIDMALKIDPEILMTFLLLLCFSSESIPLDKKSFTTRFFQGICLIGAALFRGTILPTIFLYSIFLCWRVFLNRKLKVELWGLITGVLVILIPWTLFANGFNIENQESRKAWAKNNDLSTPDLSILQKTFSVEMEFSERVIEYLYRKEYAVYAKTNSWFLLTPQAEGDQILSMHNEYCYDGDFHFEWILIQNSFYNNLPKNSGTLSKLVDFYSFYSPFPIIISKLQRTFKQTWRAFALIAILFLWILFFLKGSRTKSNELLPSYILLAILITNLLCISIFVFPGDPLFLALSDGIIILFAGLLLPLIIQCLKGRNM